MPATATVLADPGNAIANAGLAPAPFRVTVALDRLRLRQWHVDLMKRLGAMPGVEARVDFVEGDNGLPASAGLMFELERLACGTPPPRAVAPEPPSAFDAWRGDQRSDVVVDLSGRPGSGDACVLIIDGDIGEAALLAALMDGHPPLAELRKGDLVLVSGLLGTEYPGVLGAAYEDGLRRIATLIARGITVVRTGDVPSPTAPRPTASRRRPLGSVLSAKKLTRAIVGRLYRLCFHSPQWRVGWRTIGADGDLFDLKRHPTSGWRDLADDGRRFYADPFPILHQGRTHLFVEDYVHALGKGIISAAEFGPSGPLGPFEPVLETPFHLSYPFVFEDAGSIWMIPESNAACSIDLYRATRFPGGWVKEATLVDRVAASDATLVRRDGRWWMFATVRDGGGSYSDALYLWSSRELAGPWQPHPANPVLIDSASARPAGRMIERNGVLWRPVQDCRDRYGGALALALVDRLDDEGFSQTVQAVLQAGSPQWPGRRLHTLNRAGSLEFIDGSGKPPRRFF